MTSIFRPVAAVLAATLLASAAGGASAEPAAQPPSLNVVQGPLSGVEGEDFAAYLRAMDDFQAKGFAGLKRHLPRLRQALEGAPASYPLIEGKGREWIMRSNDLSDMLLLMDMTSEAAQREGVEAARVDRRPNVYPMIAFVLGSEAVEHKRLDEAIGYLDRGLAMQPGNWLLVVEKSAALQGQHRWADALALIDGTLAHADAMVLANAAPLHRNRGFSLIELGRLDEAKAAYEKSLEVEPGNKLALRELEYIRGLKAGGPTAPMELAIPGAEP